MRLPSMIIEESAYAELDAKARNERVRSGIAKRLKNACGYLPEAEFLVLVDKIANVQLVAERALARKAISDMSRRMGR